VPGCTRGREALVERDLAALHEHLGGLVAGHPVDEGGSHVGMRRRGGDGERKAGTSGRDQATLGIEELLHRKPRALSGGQRQRVALGRALVREPQVFLMDEPLSNLDAKLRVQTRSEIKRLQAQIGTTTIYVTHDQVEAMTMGDRVVVMRDGVLAQVGSPTTYTSSRPTCSSPASSAARR